MSDLRYDPDRVLAVFGKYDGQCGNESYLDRRAVSRYGTLRFGFLVPRQIGATAVSVLARSGDGHTEKTFSLDWEGLFGSSDRFSIDLTGKLPVGLWFLSFYTESGIGKVWFHRASDGTVVFSKREPFEQESFQLTVTVFPKRKIASDGGVYHVFVDRFRRGKDTPVPEGMEFVSDWDSHDLEYPDYPGAPMKNNRVWGGNLSGVTEKLDLIASLGATLIYLSPIFLSPSNHRYDTSDYLTIDPFVGDEDDLSELILEAKKRGIGVLLDGVFNHTGSDSVYFNQKGRFPSLGACQGEASPYYRWYNFRRFPDKYECWWDIPILPRINPDEPSCRAFFVGEKGVIDHYAALGVKGFRLDVADELSDGFIREIRARLSRYSSNNLLYGEVWEDASNKIAYGKRKEYYLGGELDGVMNYPFRTAALAYIRTGNTDPLNEYIGEIMPNMPREVRDLQLNLLGSHDTPRALTALGGEPENGRTVKQLSGVKMTGEEYAVARKRLILAYLMASTFPGRPMIYYGDEAGSEGYADPMNRMPYPWGKEDRTLLDAYQEIGKLRSLNPALQNGSFKLLHLDESLLVYRRKAGKSAVVVFINRSQNDLKVASDAKYRDIIKGRMVKGSFALKSLSGAVLSESDI
ncbi:MAG: glycoside hydrolase family 13 protein [Clostridia bacterium]|nr:glycoside hydrolase family 13 protein [Clostridia bacterium]